VYDRLNLKSFPKEARLRKPSWRDVLGELNRLPSVRLKMEEALSELSQRIRTALASPIRDDRTIDPLRELAEVLEGVGLDLGSAGGKVTFTGA